MLSNEPIVSPDASGSAESRTAAAKPRLKLVCRKIRDEDLDAVADCLTRGFPERSIAYWRRGLLRLRDRAVPESFPRYGYILTADGAVVGIVLLIFAIADDGSVRANVSSWCVDDAYRGYSNMLLAAAFRAKDVTFFNISASPWTLQVIEAQGFRPYVLGTFHAAAALGRRVPGADVRAVDASTPDASSLLAEHAACGCICLEVVYRGTAYPFVFLPSRSAGNRLPSAQLVYCRSLAEMARFAGPVGRHLLRTGFVSIAIDATGPIPGLIGHYAVGKRMKYFRGPAAPRLGDLSATELVYLGP
ncbi:Acyl-CoA acyltransferase [Beijerinckiaceae bacterium RH AL1]|nr:acyl-CoA acyltransferase [Beijerinckiaceae bacterium]VVB48123.1 Acyl-CoA acyltransferase [Beijerinckiaceae bacterium RH CH11]VVB48200.1 Acyl-CoA acyltransferase [Beijerinckiaceae bacterium RH AL8]VVC56234.1 Acyl-CoA acyltransferase [Beijerinckiaceae bacterium RH AL1]